MTGDAALILIVEDEPPIRRLLRTTLSAHDYRTIEAGSGAEALSGLRHHRPDLVLLDLGLPDMDGLQLLSQIRKLSPVPIVVLSSRGDEAGKVAALDTGADDYVTKPYSARELIARIRAVLRRGADVDDGGGGDGVLTVGPVRMDVERHVVSVNGSSITLPLKEFDLLEYLMRNSGRVLTRGQLIDRVWGADYVGDTKTLDVHVKRLRSKIEADPANPVHLVTVRGLGYKLEG